MLNLSTKIISPLDMSAQQAACWAKFRAANPVLYSPYFALAYTQVLAKTCLDVHVLEIMGAGKPIAFLPFQARIKPNGRIGFARPVGAPMSDYHGFICASDTRFDRQHALKSAGFGSYSFSALVDPKALPGAHIASPVPCAVMDLTGGADAWRAARDSSYRRHLKSHRRRVRKAEELGERRFAFNANGEDVFEQLMQWKRQKFAQTGKYDVLCVPWTRALLRQLWQQGEGADIRADMHVLYFGDTLAAIDLGLTDGTIFHSWMVAYDHQFQHLAPGIQLLEALIDEAGALGYKRIDLGVGLEGYKRQYASEDIRVSSGFIAAHGPQAAFLKLYDRAEKFGDKNLGKFGRLPAKARRRYTQISACDPSFKGRGKAVLAAIKPGI